VRNNQIQEKLIFLAILDKPLTVNFFTEIKLDKRRLIYISKHQINISIQTTNYIPVPIPNKV